MDHSRRRHSRRLLRGLLLVALGALVLSVAPTPAFQFVGSASATTAGLDVVEPVDAAELAALRAASDEPLDEGRVAGGADDVASFELLGVTLSEEPTEPVMVRVRDEDGWGEWNALEYEGDMGPDAATAEHSDVGDTAGRFATDPIWVGDAVGYEVSVGPDDVADIEVELVRSELQRTVVDSVPLADAAVPAPFGIHSRASWSARAPASTPSYAPSVRLAVVHHTASSNGYSAAQVPGIIRSIQAYHMDSNGWSDIAYNFMVDRFGGIWEGRAGGTTRPVIGAHARGFNTGSVGVSVIGNYQGTAASAASLEAVSRITGYRLQEYGVGPQTRVNVTSLGSTTIPAGQVVNLPAVVGHRDVGATSCPGSIYSSLASIARRANDWYNVMEALTTPQGSIDAVKVGNGRVDVSGWARDPDVPGVPSTVHVVLAGRLGIVTANGYRPDVERAHPGHGDRRGWGAGFGNVPAGTHRLCVTVINQGSGNNKLLGCQNVVVK